ncbi:MAG: hypothetical protein MAG551_01539 [Candidatus Scalindua arabica]|uniref:Uncharacterized protein n=1 Tax=Candidatus Scalindua arabica TaxID=1127984 RepID=A0A942A114_9BACT|nr:hypothetical protein [Candidatus Scalindua arabica]
MKDLVSNYVQTVRVCISRNKAKECSPLPVLESAEDKEALICHYKYRNPKYEIRNNFK